MADLNLNNLSTRTLMEQMPKFKEADFQALFLNSKFVSEHKALIESAIEYLAKNNPQTLKKYLTSDFWAEYSKTKSVYHAIGWLSTQPIGAEIFSNENLDVLNQDVNFRKNIFPEVSSDKKSLYILEFINNIHEKDVDKLIELLPFLYGEEGPIGSRINNTIFDIDTDKDFIYPTNYNPFEGNVKNIESVANCFENTRIAKLFLENFGLLSGLSIEDRTKLFNSVDLQNLSELELQNVTKLLYNGFLTEFDETLFKNKDFINNLIFNTTLTDFRRISKTIRQTHPTLFQDLIELKDRQIDSLLYDRNGKINKSNYPQMTYKNGDFDTYLNLLVYRYFKTCPQDLYTTVKLIQSARKSLEIDNHISPEGQNLLNSLTEILNARNGNDINDFTLSKIHYFKDKKLIANLQTDIISYNKQRGNIELGDLVDRCRREFARTVDENLTNKNSNEVKRKILNGVSVYDLTDCSDFKLLVHATENPEIKPIEQGKEPLVSMSILDNNHLNTYHPSNSKFIFGYDSLEHDALLHAFPVDSFTKMSVSSKILTYLRISNLAPVYTDLESFMNASSIENYNEVKIKANPNSLNASGQKIMKPSYLLYKISDGNYIPEEIIKVAKENSLDIFVVDPQKVKKKHYNATISKEIIDSYAVRYKENGFI